MSPVANSRSRTTAVGLAVLVALVTAFALPASAESRRDVVTDQQPDHELEVLSLACRIIDHATDHAIDLSVDRPSDEPTRIHIGCRWRPAEHQRAAGYQLWRAVDRDGRELVARGGLDMVGARDVVSAKAHLVRYAVIAVDEHGRRVGQSRVVEIRLHDDRPDDRPVRFRVLNIR